jgi:mono/diheme cytochrome c family protein
LQWWTNAYDYPLVISGKPLWSIPANIPVMFELTVLLAGLTAFFGMLVLNLLPEHYSPLFKVDRFKRATSDGFFISIEAKDALFDKQKTQDLLQRAGATHVELVMDEPKRAWAFPRGIIYAGVIVTCATFVPLAMIAQARYIKTPLTRVHLIPDMDAQPKYKAQAPSAFFADKRAYRDPLPGTVAVGQLRDDDHFYKGTVAGAPAQDFPAQIALTETTVKRGQERFQIYCSPCHAAAGGGDGMVARRADELKEGTWVKPTSLHDPRVRAQAPGEVFATITNGIRNMPSYSGQISVEDRWAIVMYVKALERSQFASLNDVPAEKQAELR